MQFVSLCLPHFSSYEVNVPFYCCCCYCILGCWFLVCILFFGGGGWRDLFSFHFCFVFLFCLFSIPGVWPISMIVINSKTIDLYSHSHLQIHLRSVFHSDSLNQLRVHVPKAIHKINSVNQSCFCLPTFSSLFFFFFFFLLFPFLVSFSVSGPRVLIWMGISPPHWYYVYPLC